MSTSTAYTRRPFGQQSEIGRVGRGAVRSVAMLLFWVGVPAAWLLGAGLVGTHLKSETAFYGTAAVFVMLLVGLPLTMVALGRRLFPGRAAAPADGAVRVRRPQLRQMRAPEVLEAPRPARPPIARSRRVAAAALLAFMFVASLSLWTAVPIGWVWIGSQLAGGYEPRMAPYLLILTGIPTTIVVVVKALFRLDSAYARLTRQQLGHDARSVWLKSFTDARQRRPWSTLDATMVVSVIVAILCMLVWFAFIAEQHSVMNWYMD